MYGGHTLALGTGAMQTGSEGTLPAVAPGTVHRRDRLGTDVADTVVGTVGVDVGTRWRGIRAGTRR